MNRIAVVVSLVLVMLTASLATAQEKNSTELKAEIAALESRLADQQAAQGTMASKFAGFGKELGVAFNGFIEAMDGGMKVTTTRVNEFAQTDVGKFAMFAIGWKIFAADIASMIKSCVLLVLGLMFLLSALGIIKSVGQNIFFGRMVVTKREGPWYKRSVTRERVQPLNKMLGGGTTSEQDVAINFYYITHGIAAAVCMLAMAICFCNM